MALPINTEGLLYQRYLPKWLKVSPAALMGGTDEMRLCRERYLPKEELESDDNYNLRLQHSFLYNGFRDTIEKCAAKPFSREVALKNPTSRIEPMVKNADQRGQSLTQVLRQYFIYGICYGVGHMIVDLPNMAKVIPPGQEATLADEVNKLFPFVTVISPLQLIWWSWKDTGDGPVLTKIRIRDYVIRESKVDPTLQVEYERITEYTDTTWAIYEAIRGSADFTVVEEGTHSFKQVPIFSWFANEEVAPLVALPPLMDLADLNIAHWQSSSQQRNYLRFIRIGFLLITGATEDDIKRTNGGEIKLGPQNVLCLENTASSAKYLEHQGTAFDAGKSDLEKLESQMTILGLQPLIEMASNTATGSAIPESKYQSRLQMWTKMCSRKATAALAAGSAVAGEDPPEDFEVAIYSDFGISVDNIQKVDKIFTAYQNKLITAETALRELQRYGILAESIEPEEEVLEAKDEATSNALNSLGLSDNADPNADGSMMDPNEPMTGKGMNIDGKPPANTKNPNVPKKKFRPQSMNQNPKKQ